MEEIFLARKDKNGNTQTLERHLQNVSKICADFCKNYSHIASLLGLVHDMGKSCNQFQRRLNGENKRVDHSSSSAIFLLKEIIDVENLSLEENYYFKFVILMCAFASSCHHKGLIDMIIREESEFDILLGKLKDKEFSNNYSEVLQNAELCNQIKQLAKSEEFNIDCKRFFENLVRLQNLEGNSACNFYIGMYFRYFYSLLIDADRTDAGNFDNKIEHREYKEVECERLENFNKLCDKLDEKINSYPKNSLNQIRSEIYNKCIEGAQKTDNLFNLNVQTGGGKTFSSFRFALERIKLRKASRIIYVAPFISIIEQNADEIRKLLKELNLEDMLIESHSNVLVEKKGEEEYEPSKHEKLFSNFSEPIIFTTMVGFLESVYGDSTQNNRRLHNMENSVIIFDEIQNLPTNCIGLFNLLVKFLFTDLNSTILLCTATQPALSKLSYFNKKEDTSLIELPESQPLVTKKYDFLKRTEIIREDKDEMDLMEAVNFVCNKLQESKNILFVVNTRKAARELFLALKDKVKTYHLSTNMCPEHRLEVINLVKSKLEESKNFVLISTQLIEAGVDLDFECVIRSQSGLESIIQAAGRCNREGKLKDADGNKKLGKVFVVKLCKELENLDYLPEIAVRQEKFKDVCVINNKDLADDSTIEDYFKRLYDGESKSKLSFEIKSDSANAVDLLIGRGQKIESKFNMLRFQFGTVSSNFKMINSQDQIGVLVNYKEGGEFINDLVGGKNLSFRNIQRYMVNVFTNKLNSFHCQNYLDVCFSLNYDKDLGLVEDNNIEYDFYGGSCL